MATVSGAFGDKYLCLTYVLCSFMCGIGTSLYQASLLWPGLSFVKKTVT